MRSDAMPGMREIMELYNALQKFEEVSGPGGSDWNRWPRPKIIRFRVSPLHSQIPQEEQENAVFHAPDRDTCHVRNKLNFHRDEHYCIIQK